MKCLFALSIILPVLASCQPAPEVISSNGQNTPDADSSINPFASIGDISLPGGYERVEVPPNSFSSFLRKLPLKKSRTIFLYNGQPKASQYGQFAVIDMSTGNKDLQQCADVIMRLRAEYHYEHKQFNQIRFMDNANIEYQYSENINRKAFDKYLEKVFSYCGTLSLEKQLYKRAKMEDAVIGDVLINGGSPGHAMIIADMAVNKEGKRIFLLVQGFLPAQDMHVVKNLENPNVSPWYLIDNESDINTPGWTFNPSALRHW